MDSKRLVTGTVVGAIVMFVLAFVLFDLVLGSFYEANTNPGAAREAEIFWAMGIGTLAHAALLTLVLGWAGATSAGAGLRVGAIFGFLLWLGVDFFFYGIMDMGNLVIALVDPLVEVVHMGITGAVVAAVINRGGGQ